MEKNTLVQTNGNFRLRGIITGKDNPKNGFGLREDKTQDGKPYRSIRFSIQTSPDNIVPVELYGQVREFANWYSKKEKKNIKVDWAKRFDKPYNGYSLIMPDYDLVKTINNDFKDGDSVVVIGDLNFRTYENNQGKMVEQTVYAIKSIFTSTSGIDFNKDDFEEECTFAQEIIIRDMEEDKQENKLYIYAYTIAYGEKFYPASFEINLETASPAFVRNMKALRFGDFIKVNGKIHSRVLKKEVKEDDGWGTTERVVTSYYKALEITGANPETLERKKYREEDFVLNDVDGIYNGTNKDVQEKMGNANNNNEGDEELPFNMN